MAIVDPSSQQLTLEGFLKLPETKPYSEYIEEKVFQKAMPGGKHSTIQGELTSAINCLGESQKTALALLELQCVFSGWAITPDIAVFKWERIPITEGGRIANEFLIYPDWIVEILSPEESGTRAIRKILFCLQHGTQLGWLVDPEDKSVMILTPNCLPEIKAGEEILPAIDCLKNLELSAKEMFDWLIF